MGGEVKELFQCSVCFAGSPSQNRNIQSVLAASVELGDVVGWFVRFFLAMWTALGAC